jgi:Ca2+-binding EF-hand superfamily protein
MQARQYVSLLAAVLVLGTCSEAGAQSTRAQSRGRQMRFQAMDRDGDGVITRAEWRGNAQSFRQHDLNNDGVLSGDEVWVPANEAGQNRADRDDDQRSLVAAFRRTDRNGDGQIARDEWYGDLATFERVDRDDNGRISQAEFLGEEVVDTSGGMSFDELDRNGNDVVTLNEWVGERDEFNDLDADGDSVLTRAEFQARAAADRSPAYRAGRVRGLAEGRQAGQQDRKAGRGWDLDGQRELEQADSGYTPAVGSRIEYQAGYRAGFRRGYEQGFGRR